MAKDLNPKNQLDPFTIRIHAEAADKKRREEAKAREDRKAAEKAVLVLQAEALKRQGT